MPFYDYKCKNDHTVEVLRPVDNRNKRLVCVECGLSMKLQVGTPHFAAMKMGVSKDFPTFAAKWDKAQRAKNSGRMKDSNNRQASDGTLNKAGLL